MIYNDFSPFLWYNIYKPKTKTHKNGEKIMRNKFVQISLADIYNDISFSIQEQKPELLALLDEYIDFDSFISDDFFHAFYKRFGRKHTYHLDSFIRALVIQKLFGFTFDKQLILVLKCSKEIRDFCMFDKVPDASYFTRFKQQFSDYIADMFERLVDITEPICREIDSKKSDYLIFDTTGIEPFVAENNPKFFNTKLQTAKKLSKSNPNYNPYLAVYGLLPDTAASNANIKQQYINGHYCYAYKAGIVTNGLGIVRNITFFDNDFKKQHPEIVSHKTDNPNIDKEISDSSALKPVLRDFFKSHSNFTYSTFLGDAAFDSYDNYSMLKNDFHFNRVCIPLNLRNSKKANTSFDEFGTPICPIDKTPFTFLGKSGGKNRSARFKWVCHKSKPCGTSRICTCETPCTESSYGKCTYTYPDKDFRLYPGIPRNTEHWERLYNVRVVIERTINLFKDTLGVASLKTQNETTIKTDLYLAGITQLIGVILAKELQKPKLYKSVRKLISAL